MLVMTEVSSLTGRLLVATPALADPNFDRAVVLLLDHDEEGTLGVVLNRPTPVGVGDVLEAWAQLAGVPQVVFQGGPVSLDSALGLAVVPGEAREGEEDEPLGWRRVHGAIGLVDL
jgi:putative transcriptional regulator